MPCECRTVSRDQGTGAIVPGRVFWPKDNISQTRLDMACIQKVQAGAKYGLLGISFRTARCQEEFGAT
jgi:hypothetical protein